MSKKEINWGDPNLDLDEVLWIPDIDKEEWFYKDNNAFTKKCWENEIDQIKKDINEDFYWQQEYSYKFILED